MAILMTGLTGILGSAVGPALKEEAFFLVRGGRSNERIPAGIDPERIIAGDITKPLCGLSVEDVRRLKDQDVDRMLHLAADVSFAIIDTDGNIRKTNFTGTQNAVALAKGLGVEEFHYCSTVFADSRRNPYEISKSDAEELVKASGMPYSIYKPSAMVGHSVTGKVAQFNGFYGAYSIFYLVAERIRKGETGKPVHLPVYVVCSSTSTLNLIPVNWVSETFIKLMRHGAKNEIYNLADDNPPKVRWIVERGFEILGISGIRYVERPLTLAQKIELHKKDKVMLFYQKWIDSILDQFHPYVTEEGKFPLDTTMATLGTEFKEPPEITVEFLSLLFNYAVEKNFGHSRGAGRAQRKEKNGLVHLPSLTQA